MNGISDGGKKIKINISKKRRNIDMILGAKNVNSKIK